MIPVPRYLWMTAGLVVVAIVVLWFVLEDEPVDRESARANLPEELKPHADLIMEIEELSVTDPQRAEQKSRELLEKLPEGRFKQRYELAFHAGIEEIRFYGKVVDQFGIPLAGARIHFEAAGKFLGQGSGMGSVESAADGTFLIEARGGSLTVHNIRHPNAMYAALPESAAGSSRMYDTGNTFWSYTRRVGGDNLIWTDSAADPVVFDMWVVDREQAERYANDILWDSQFIKLSADGAEHTVSFGGEGRPFSVSAEASEEGDLSIGCQADAMSEPGDRGEWAVTIAPIRGGIQPTEDRYLNQAPDAGYQTSVEIGSPTLDENAGANVFGRRFYFTARDSRYYGALFIDIEPFNLPFSFKTREYGEQYCRVRIEYKVNRAGSTYLFKNRRLLAEAGRQ